MSCHKSGAMRKFDVQTYEFVSRLRIKNSGRIKVRDFACSTLVTRRILFFLLRAPPSQCSATWHLPCVMWLAVAISFFTERSNNVERIAPKEYQEGQETRILSQRLAMKSAEVFLVLIEEKSIVTWCSKQTFLLTLQFTAVLVAWYANRSVSKALW